VVGGYFNQQTGMDLTPIFDQYLRHAALPALELRWNESAVSYRWKADEAGFRMPIRVGSKEHMGRLFDPPPIGRP